MPLELIIDVGNMVGIIGGILVIVITISLNIFIILTVVLDKSMRNYTNVQFASMSIADTLVACVAMPLLLASHSMYGLWPYTENLCILFIVGDFVGGNISIITLTIISWHRLECIRKPYVQRNKSMGDNLLPALVIWPLVFSFWTLLAIYIVKVRNRFMSLEDCFFLYSFEYVVVVDLIAYVLPICLLVYFQVGIYLGLRNKNNFIKPVASGQSFSADVIHAAFGLHNAKTDDQRLSIFYQFISLFFSSTLQFQRQVEKQTVHRLDRTPRALEFEKPGEIFSQLLAKVTQKHGPGHSALLDHPNELDFRRRRLDKRTSSGAGRINTQIASPSTLTSHHRHIDIQFKRN